MAVLDTGIAPHPDLRIGGGYNCSVEDGRDPTKYTDRYGHGTHVAGTIAAKDNGIGVVGVAPNSRLLPIVISQVDRGLLARLSTIAEAIEAATQAGVDVINISAKWPVDSRAISTAVQRAVTGEASGKRLIVTGYATSLDIDDSVREYFPSRARELQIDACMGDDARPWSASSNRWELPRYVHGRDWHAPEDLAKLLRDAA